MSLEMQARIKALETRLDELEKARTEEVSYDFVVDWCKKLQKRLDDIEAHANRLRVDVQERMRQLDQALQRKADRAGRKPRAT